MVLWALMLLLSLVEYFASLWHSGMKRLGLTLHDCVHETCSSFDMQLVLHEALRVSVSPTIVKIQFTLLLITLVSPLWFMFVGRLDLTRKP